MTKRDRKALGEYLRWAADAMELRDWTVTLLDKTPENEAALAEVECVYGRKLARVAVSSGFRDLAPDDQRHTIAHELVHCHLEPAWSMVRNDLQRHLGETGDRVFWDAWRRNAEYAVDALASATAKHLPLIDWPE